MRPLGLLAFALSASALLLPAQGTQRSKGGLYASSAARLSTSERPSGSHLPTYMMHLYRNFRSNFSRPLDTLEQSGAQQADTVQSVVAKSKTFPHFSYTPTDAVELVKTRFSHEPFSRARWVLFWHK